LGSELGSEQFWQDVQPHEAQFSGAWAQLPCTHAIGLRPWADRQPVNEVNTVSARMTWITRFISADSFSFDTRKGPSPMELSSV
jgi:hypothetical protein